jgi:hypothetical protein
MDARQQLTALLGQTGTVQSRIQEHINALPLETSPPLETQATPENPPPLANPSPAKKKLVYLAYTYLGIPQYVDILREDLKDKYLIFNPLAAVEEQFSADDIASLLVDPHQLKELPDGITRNIQDPYVVEFLRRGDTQTDINAMIFKELYFLARSSVVICDLVMLPYGCEMFQKLFYAKMLNIPVIGISPIGKNVSAYIQKYLRVLLTDSFNTENILPLLRAYTD